MVQKLRELCAAQIQGDTYRNLNIHPTFSARTFKHILVPLWLLTYTYGPTVYQVLVNGHTGRMAGQYPKSPWKVAFLVIGIIIVRVDPPDPRQQQVTGAPLSASNKHVRQENQAPDPRRGSERTRRAHAGTSQARCARRQARAAVSRGHAEGAVRSWLFLGRRTQVLGAAGCLYDRGRLRGRLHAEPDVSRSVQRASPATRRWCWSCSIRNGFRTTSCSRRSGRATIPTQGMRQGNDVGTQYRSGIYYYDDAQRAAAERTRDEYQRALAAKGYGAITTEILRRAGVLLRRGLPPAIPVEESWRLLRPRRDRSLVSDRTGRVSRHPLGATLAGTLLFVIGLAIAAGTYENWLERARAAEQLRHGRGNGRGGPWREGFRRGRWSRS